eukprot:COSAG02_NODE_62562_length_265_cov_1.120482_1_plen_60_part_01
MVLLIALCVRSLGSELSRSLSARRVDSQRRVLLTAYAYCCCSVCSDLVPVRNRRQAVQQL